ncbi:MAG: GGDEF domain-containing protein [Sulfuritalea sp.]|nr:GGDEF domain-containing protein [Sulfuritalea sp.]
MRKTDLVARFGGDEFAVLLPEIEYDNAVDAARQIAALLISLAGILAVSVSVGVAWFDDAGIGFPAMLKAADELMYDIKKEGKHGTRARCFTSQSAISH